ncbi:MAG: hypothetical protein U1D30_25255 [Planctomycetota bacterium]
MSPLGTFLEALFCKPEPFETAQGTLRHWQDVSFRRGASDTAGRVGRVGKNPPPAASSEKQTNYSFWIRSPARWRLEPIEPQDGSSTFFISTDTRYWFRNKSGEIETDERKEIRGSPAPAPGGIELDRHFDGRQIREFLVSLKLEYLDNVTTADQQCARFRAIPRAGARIWPHWLPHGADEYLMHGDLLRGTLLLIEGRKSGKAFERHEVMSLVYDGEIDESRFTYQPLASESVSTPKPIMETLTLDDAIARMPFPILLPTKMPWDKPASFTFRFHPPRKGSHRSQLLLSSSGDRVFWMAQSDVPDPDLGRLEWESILHSDQAMKVSDPGDGGGLKVVTLEREGTHVSLYAEMDRRELLDIAASLMPAKRG